MCIINESMFSRGVKYATVTERKSIYSR